MDMVTVVLDIGKTNKKIVVYDSKMKLLTIYSKSFPSLAFEDLRVEQVQAIENWFLDILREISASFLVAAISITTHGAAAVCIGSDGLPAVPVIDYTTGVDEGVHERFYRAAGTRDMLQRETCTPEVKPLINLAKLLFFTRERFPAEFAKVKTILCYPQYFSYRLTGEICADYTYLGCHTYLWDFKKNTWSDVVARLGFQGLFPQRIEYPGSVAGGIAKKIAERTGIAQGTPVLVGIHDSNSSLIPYLISGSGNFLLNSTGTWCVAMHPEKSAVLKDDDIGNTVFFNLSVANAPIKTAIFLGGLELDGWISVLHKMHGRSDYPDYSHALAQEVLAEASEFILPGIVQGAGQYPSSHARLVSGGIEYLFEDIKNGVACPPLFLNFEKAYMVLLMSLALHTQVAFLRAGLKPGMPVYVEGKFRQSTAYTTLVASLFPKNPLYITGIAEATSFGAALLAWAAVNKVELSSMRSLARFETLPVMPVKLEGLERYSLTFFSLLA